MEEKTKAIVGLISGLISILFLHIIFAPLAIYLGIKARKNNFKKLGIVSIIFGVIGILMMLLIPTLKIVLDNDYPVTVMVSGSMSHNIENNKICNSFVATIQNKKLNLDEWWSYCGNIYSSNFNIQKNDFESYPISNGFDIGDVLIIKNTAPNNLNVGDIMLFKPQDENYFKIQGPVVHRIINKWEVNGKIYFATKGDHNSNTFENFENNIPEENVIGKVVSRVPKLGYIKITIQNILR